MNTRSKHTPGPWAVRHDDMVCSKEGRIIADCESTSPPIAEDKANATLIAAAPAMYEALLSILPATDIVSGQETDNCRWCGRDYTDHAVETGETLELCSSDDCPGYIARAALAQAEGRR